MKPKKSPLHSILLTFLGLSAAGLSSFCAQAANEAWSTNTPGPADGNFGGINWSVGTTGVATPTNAAASGDALFFDTSAITTLTNDLSGPTFAGITFNSGASAYTIGGSPFTLSGALTNNSSSLQTFSNDIALQNPQTITGSDAFSLSGNLTGAGNLTKSGTGTLSLAGTTNAITGNLVLSAGLLNVTAGTTNFAGGFSNFANTASTTATTSISSGATLGWTGANGGNFGGASSASAVLYNSGSYNQSATTANNAGIYLGNAASSYGYLRNDSGATSTVGGRLWIAQAANAAGAAGVLDVTGGTVTVSGTNQNFDSVLRINTDGNTHATSTSYAGINVVGGTLAIGKAAQTNINGKPNNGTGILAAINVQNTYTSFNITGTTGKFTAGTGDSGIGLGVTSNATNIATLAVSNGGTLEASYIFGSNALGTNTMGFDNGTIRAIATNAGGLIQSGSFNVFIQSGGMTVDSNGFNPKIGAVLKTPTDNGIDTITLGGTATGYVGAPVVAITGGGGTGAAAIANFDPTTGTVTGFTITSKGSGYTSVPTITLVGGNGGTTGAGAGTATATATIAAVSSGGLTKEGVGTLTLSGPNTYTGATKVNTGTLALASTGSIANNSPVTLAAGAVLDTSAQTSFALAATQPVTFGLNPDAAGSSGKIHAAALDISAAVVTFSPTATLDDAVYILADYTGLAGATFASATPPSGYSIAYDYNGNTQIALVLTGGYTYTTWANANGATGQTVDQDHDNDGVDNGIEYFMGATGSTFTATPTLVGGSTGTVTWPMGGSYAYSGNYGTSYLVQTSPDLVTWTQAPPGTGPNTVTVTAGVSVVYTMPSSGTKLFVRLVVNN